ncbi:type II toxin-antitoxin system HigB family toxin [Hymenobacter sp. H14-R3]|nr:type II toxin-antitoxin system HigB family toxin [Hymenobacter sp. H14-R3]
MRAFAEAHPDTDAALEEWYHHVLAADWANGVAVRQSFNSADYVGHGRFVFNIRGNRYRLIASINFSVRTIYIKFIGTHQEYDAVAASTVLFIKP